MLHLHDPSFSQVEADAFQVLSLVRNSEVGGWVRLRLCWLRHWLRQNIFRTLTLDPGIPETVWIEGQKDRGTEMVQAKPMNEAGRYPSFQKYAAW